MADVFGSIGSNLGSTGSWTVRNDPLSIKSWMQSGSSDSYNNWRNRMLSAQTAQNTVTLPNVAGGPMTPTTPTTPAVSPTTSVTTPLSSSGTTSAQDLQQIADPFASQRAQYQNQLSQLISNPDSIANTGAYKFALDQGQQTLERSQAAKGMNLSGNALAELTKYGQGMASQQFNNYANLLSELSGAAPGSPAEAASAIVNQEGNQNDLAAKMALLNSNNYWSGLNYAKGNGYTPPQMSYAIV